MIGVLERGGRVHAEVADRWAPITGFIERFVERDGTILMTDQDPSYRYLGRKMAHSVINHSLSYVEGLVHTNTIEGFWSLVKRAWYGTHHHYSEKYMPLYIAEACWKYNNRKENGGAFRKTLKGFVR